MTRAYRASFSGAGDRLAGCWFSWWDIRRGCGCSVTCFRGAVFCERLMSTSFAEGRQAKVGLIGRFGS
jgi:hypothetical protein